ALRAHDGGAEVVVLERDASPFGSTSMSSGFIPAAGTRTQRSLGIADSADRFFGDLRLKAKGKNDPALARLAADNIGPALDWLAADHGLEWVILDDFLYPGHSAHRMHAVPEKTGAGLLSRLLRATERAGIAVVTNALASGLFVQHDRVKGVQITRPDGALENTGCDALILASSGFGANAGLVGRHIPTMSNAPYHGHAGNTGDALAWGLAMGAGVRHLSGCQGHGSLAHPVGILISWALMMEGGIQVNARARRFSDEHQGYSEQAVPVLKQPGAIAWCVFDGRIMEMAKAFPDFLQAIDAGAIKSGLSASGLAEATGLPADALAKTIARTADMAQGARSDPFGRDFTTRPQLCAPFYAVRVTGALFHTQGGLVIDHHGRVLRPDGAVLPNLYAGGGAACGVSGPDISGYLSGNGLLGAIAFGMLSGEHAAKR
ncbi:MAG: FAD-binding protein, partial [Hyphomicrobiales bacterium]